MTMNYSSRQVAVAFKHSDDKDKQSLLMNILRQMTDFDTIDFTIY